MMCENIVVLLPDIGRAVHVARAAICQEGSVTATAVTGKGDRRDPHSSGFSMRRAPPGARPGPQQLLQGGFGRGRETFHAVVSANALRRHIIGAIASLLMVAVSSVMHEDRKQK